jgi:hypothetical protein
MEWLLLSRSYLYLLIPGSSFRRLWADQHHGEAQNDHAAMSRHITHARRGLAANQDGKGAQNYNVGRTDTNCHVAYASGWQAANQHKGTTRRKDWSADMWNQYGHHWADMHIGDPSCRLSHTLFPFSG